MNNRHINEDNAPHDADDEALDALLTGADDDLRNALGAALNVDAGLAAIVETAPTISEARTSTSGRAVGSGPLVNFSGNAGFAGAFAGRGGDYSAAGLGGMGQDREDEEHSRPSYLVEQDADGLFSSDEMTAPPVIGEPHDGAADNDTSEG